MPNQETHKTAPPRSPAAHVGQGDTIALFGEILADVFPERAVLGGAPFNVARHLAAFGLAPVLLSRVGDDTLGGEVLDMMSRSGMATLGVQIDPLLPTGRVQVHMESSGHRFEILPMQAYDFIDAATACDAVRSADPSLLYFGTLCQRHKVSRQALRTVFHSTPTPRFLDINLREPWYEDDTIEFSLRHANFIKLNSEELEILSEVSHIHGISLQDRAGKLMRKFGTSHLIVTCGQDGAWRMDEQGEIHDVQDRKKLLNIVDTVGAGDGFSAVCILGMMRRWPVAVALRRADAFAAAICGIRGAIPDREDFYQPFFKEWNL
jgi:fructokinase